MFWINSPWITDDGNKSNNNNITIAEAMTSLSIWKGVLFVNHNANNRQLSVIYTLSSAFQIAQAGIFLSSAS